MVLRFWALTSFLSAFDVSLLYLYFFFLSFCVVGSCCVGLVGESLPCPFLSFSFLNSVVVLLYKIFYYLFILFFSSLPLSLSNYIWLSFCDFLFMCFYNTECGHKRAT